MPRRQTTIATSAQRSAVTNGSRLLVGVSGLTARSRRYRDLVELLTAEIGGELSAAEQLQIRNAATLQMHSEELTAALVRGEPVDAEAITRAANGATRALTALKRSRPAKRRGGRSVHDMLAGRMAAE